MEKIEIIKNEVCDILRVFGYKPIVKETETFIEIQFWSPGSDSFKTRYKDAIRMLIKGYLMEFYYFSDSHHIRLYKECQGQEPDSDRYSCLVSEMNKVPENSPKCNPGEEAFFNMGDYVVRICNKH